MINISQYGETIEYCSRILITIVFMSVCIYSLYKVNIDPVQRKEDIHIKVVLSALISAVFILLLLTLLFKIKVLI